MANFNKKSQDDKSGIEVKSKQSETVGGGVATPSRRSSKRGISSSVDSVNLDINEVVPDSEKDSIWAKNKNLIMGGAVALVLVVVIIALISGDDKVVPSELPVVSQTASVDGVTPSSEAVIPVVSEEDRLRQEMLQGGYGVNDASLSEVKPQIGVETETFVKDLDGADISEMYVAKTITYIQDFVSYSKHRGVTDEGIEIYWLDGQYKGKNCKLDIKYKHFQTLSEVGVVLCNIEVVETVDGNKLITWFGAVEDPLGTLNKK